MKKIISRLLDWKSKSKPPEPQRRSPAPHELALKRVDSQRRTKNADEPPLAPDKVPVSDATPAKKVGDSGYRKTKEKREKKRVAVAEARLGRVDRGNAKRRKRRTEGVAADPAVEKGPATARRRKARRRPTLPHI
jgi:hypothetical protein